MYLYEDDEIMIDSDIDGCIWVGYKGDRMYAVKHGTHGNILTNHDDFFCNKRYYWKLTYVKGEKINTNFTITKDSKGYVNGLTIKNRKNKDHWYQNMYDGTFVRKNGKHVIKACYLERFLECDIVDVYFVGFVDANKEDKKNVDEET